MSSFFFVSGQKHWDKNQPKFDIILKKLFIDNTCMFYFFISHFIYQPQPIKLETHTEKFLLWSDFKCSININFVKGIEENVTLNHKNEYLSEHTNMLFILLLLWNTNNNNKKWLILNNYNNLGRSCREYLTYILLLSQERQIVISCFCVTPFSSVHQFVLFVPYACTEKRLGDNSVDDS